MIVTGYVVAQAAVAGNVPTHRAVEASEQRVH
jgi:hypothetical protein